MGKQKKQAEQERKPRNLPVMLWVTVAAGLGYVLRDVHARGAQVYSELDSALPRVMELALQAGAFLATPVGLASSVGGLALTLTPFALGARGGFAGRLYLLLAFVAATVAVTVWFSNANALESLSQHLNAS